MNLELRKLLAASIGERDQAIELLSEPDSLLRLEELAESPDTATGAEIILLARVALSFALEVKMKRSEK